MTTRQQWSIKLANELGNLLPSQDTIRFISAWTVGEGTKARYNPLATTQPMPGATKFNDVGVKNYLTEKQGIDATVITIKNGRYPNILDGIRNNDPERALNASELATWGTGLGAVENAYRSTRRIESEGLASNIPQGTETQEIPQGTESAIIPGLPNGGTTGLGFSTPELPKTKDVVYVLLGLAMLGIAVVLAIKSFVPTKQIVETVAKAAV